MAKIELYIRKDEYKYGVTVDEPMDYVGSNNAISSTINFYGEDIDTAQGIMINYYQEVMFHGIEQLPDFDSDFLKLGKEVIDTAKEYLVVNDIEMYDIYKIKVSYNTLVVLGIQVVD